MQSHPSIVCIAGLGIRGDRYCLDGANARARHVMTMHGRTNDLGGQV
jgi:hypothetical protein